MALMNEQQIYPENPHDPEARICRYLDGEMSTEEASAFESELTRDAELQASLEAYRRLDAGLAQLTAEASARYDAQREAIMEAVMNPRRRQRQWRERWLLKPALAGLAAAAMFLLALGGYRLLSEPAGPHRGATAGSEPAQASMALVAPARTGGAVQSSLRRQGVEEYLRHRMATLGSGSVVVSVAAPDGAAATAARGGEEMGLWLN